MLESANLLYGPSSFNNLTLWSALAVSHRRCGDSRGPSIPGFKQARIKRAVISKRLPKRKKPAESSHTEPCFAFHHRCSRICHSTNPTTLLNHHISIPHHGSFERPHTGPEGHEGFKVRFSYSTFDS